MAMCFDQSFVVFRPVHDTKIKLQSQIHFKLDKCLTFYHSIIQGDSWLVDIIAGDDFLDLCDKKKINVFDFGRLGGGIFGNQL